MKSDFCFKREVVDPCPKCETPRVGFDYDDDYDIRPGILIPAQPPQCDFRFFEYEGRGRWEAYYGHRGDWSVQRIEETPETCPLCGEKLELRKEKVQIGNYRRGYMQVTVERYRCPNGQGVPEKFEALPGCKACERNFSWPGMGWKD